MNTQSFKRLMPLFAFFIMLAGARAEGDNPFSWSIWSTYFGVEQGNVRNGTIRNFHLLNSNSAIVIADNAIALLRIQDGAIIDTFPNVLKYVPLESPEHGQAAKTIGHSDLSKDGKLLVTCTYSNFSDCIVVVWDVEKKVPVKHFETPFAITDIHFSMDAKYLIATAYASDEAVVVWNTDDYSIEKTIINPARGTWLTMSPDNKYAYVTYYLKNEYVGRFTSIVKYDLSTWEPLDTFNLKNEYGWSMLENGAEFCTISPDGQYFAFKCDTTVYVYETDKLELVNRYHFTKYPTTFLTTLGPLCFSPNSDKLLLFQDNCWETNPVKTTVEWDFKSNKVITMLKSIDLGVDASRGYLNSDQVLLAGGDYIILFNPSKLASIEGDSPLSSKLQLMYENPINKNTELRAYSKEAIEAKMDIYNESGKYIKNIYSGYIKDEEISIPLDIADLNSGLYFIKISDGNTSYDYKIIVKK